MNLVVNTDVTSIVNMFGGLNISSAKLAGACGIGLICALIGRKNWRLALLLAVLGFFATLLALASLPV